MQAGVLPGVLGVGMDSRGMGASSRVIGQDYGDKGGLVGSVTWDYVTWGLTWNFCYRGLW